MPNLLWLPRMLTSPHAYPSMYSSGADEGRWLGALWTVHGERSTRTFLHKNSWDTVCIISTTITTRIFPSATVHSASHTW